jgi:hypothetical protein
MFAGEKFSVSSSTSAAGIGNLVVLVCCAAETRDCETLSPSFRPNERPNELNKKKKEYIACRETRPVLPLLSNADCPPIYNTSIEAISRAAPTRYCIPADAVDTPAIKSRQYRWHSSISLLNWTSERYRKQPC